MAILILNPLDDDEFLRLARDLAGQAGHPEALQTRLRQYYPDAVVRPRDLSGERETWYVYRDGRWVG
jgi:hypothetical protein